MFFIFSFLTGIPIPDFQLTGISVMSRSLLKIMAQWTGIQRWKGEQWISYLWLLQLVQQSLMNTSPSTLPLFNYLVAPHFKSKEDNLFYSLYVWLFFLCYPCLLHSLIDILINILELSLVTCVLLSVSLMLIYFKLTQHHSIEESHDTKHHWVFAEDSP